jgi:hypothetical protein
MDDALNTSLTLPLARCRFQFTVTHPIHLPDWSGSLLRGVFGRALHRLSCMMRQTECPGCPLFKTCPYPAIFAPPPLEHAIQRFSQPPVPYLIEPERWGERQLEEGETLQFDMVLMGRALREFPLITEAWKQAVERNLGPGDGTASLREIDYLSPTGTRVSLYDAPRKTLAEISMIPVQSPPAANLDKLTLKFVSPLRLQENRHALPPARLTPSALLTAAIRRVALMSEIHGAGTPAWDFKALDQQAGSIQGRKNLHWQDWTRRSAKQKCTMDLGGVMGEWQLSGDITAFFPALYLGQWLHLGKEIVFGLGRYELAHIA